MPEPAKKPKQYRVSGSLKSARKVTGFRALYFHYCYLLGIFPQNKLKSGKRLHFLLREDLIKLDAISEETKLLAGHHIDTVEQLVSYKGNLETQIQSLTEERKTLYRAQRTAAVKTDAVKRVEVSAGIASISKKLSLLRREVKLCDDIAIRSGAIKEKIKAVREDEQSERKEKTRDDQFRRRG